MNPLTTFFLPEIYCDECDSTNVKTEVVNPEKIRQSISETAKLKGQLNIGSKILHSKSFTTSIKCQEEECGFESTFDTQVQISLQAPGVPGQAPGQFPKRF